MAGLTLREEKGSKLTIEEMDGNLKYLENLSVTSYREAVLIEGATVATFASYTGIPDGYTTEVTITADVAGSDGNIELGSENSLAEIISAWNNDNPTNTVTLISGDDTQILATKAKINLTGGVSIGDIPDTFTVNHNLGGMMWRVSLFNAEGGIYYFTEKSDNLTFQDSSGAYRVIMSENSISILPTTQLIEGTYYLLVERLY